MAHRAGKAPEPAVRSRVSESELLSALRALQRDPDPKAPAWQVVFRFASERFVSWGDERLDDVRQETLFTAATHLDQMRATSGPEAGAWLGRIWASRKADDDRARARDPRWSPEDVSSMPTPLVGSIVAHDPLGAILRVLSEVERYVDGLPGTVRSRRRDQARAALLTVVFGLDLDELALAMRAGGIRRNTLSKWVGLGRAVVLRALDRWAAEDEDDERVGAIVEVLRELMLERRADAGEPRPGRRKVA